MEELYRQAIANCPVDGYIYLIKKVNDSAGFFVCDQHLQFLVKSSSNQKIFSKKTDYLAIISDVQISSIENDPAFESGRYNILSFLDNTNEDYLDSFIRMCQIYSQSMSPKDFVDFCNSLIDIFQLPSEQVFKNAVGLFGELSVMQYVMDNYDVDLSSYWHKNGSRSKYDFVLDSCNLEAKSTVSDDGSFHLKHEQLFNGEKNYLVTIWLKKDPQGESLLGLVKSLQKRPCFGKSIDFAVHLEEELLKVPVFKREDEKFSVRGIRFYDANQINPFPNEPDNVDFIEYDIELVESPVIDPELVLRSSLKEPEKSTCLDS